MFKRYGKGRSSTCWLQADWPQIFKIVLSKAFDLKCTIPEITNVGEPLLIYQSC
jgi:hypothetical protein